MPLIKGKPLFFHCRKRQQGTTLISLLVAMSLGLLLFAVSVRTLDAATAIWRQQQHLHKAQSHFLWIHHHFAQRFKQAGDFGYQRLGLHTPIYYPKEFPFTEWLKVLRGKGHALVANEISFVWMEPSYYRVILQTPGELSLKGPPMAGPPAPQWWALADAEGIEIVFVDPKRWKAKPDGWVIYEPLQKQFSQEIAIGRLHWAVYSMQSQGLHVSEKWGRNQWLLRAPDMSWTWKESAKGLGARIDWEGEWWIGGWRF